MEIKSGKVYIVGAGPGDPGLITLKAMDRLKKADVVVYDRLINNDLLSYCKDGCKKIFVGKESGYHPIEQECIIDILICKSKLGFDVVRLKGGNPFVFGRGSEEACALKAAGIDYEIIPGITAGLSAPVYSGIPITQRGLITQCVLITAHESPDKPETQVEWEKLAKLKNTSLIIYMGGSRIERICNELIKYGMSPLMPAAVIENGTLSRQRTIAGRLNSIAEEYKKQSLHPPVIIMISPTVTMRNEVSWYEQKPLFNKRIVFVGNREDQTDLNNLINDLGGELLSLSERNTSYDIHDTLSSDRSQFAEDIAYDLLPDYNATTEIFQYLNYNMAADISFRKYEAEEILHTIKTCGADVFIFSSSEDVQNFFNSFGTHTATLMLKRSLIIVLCHSAIIGLNKIGITNTKVLIDKTNEEIVKFICRFFNLGKE